MIRQATTSDVERCLMLGLEMHNESRYKSMSFNYEKVAVFFSFAIKSNDYLFLVAEVDGVVVGGFIGYVMPQWFSDDLSAGDFFIFIQRENRGGVIASELIGEYIKWAKEKGVSYQNIGIGISTGINHERFD